MRRRLVLVFVAISTLVTTSFVVPLGFLVRRTAEDRAVDLARTEAAAVVPTLVSGGTRAAIEAALDTTEAGREQRMTVITSQEWTIGPPIEATSRVETALAEGASSIGDVDGGVEVVTAVASGPDEMSVVRVFVPDSTLHEGQWRAWLVLGGVGVALIGISVVVADRLARTVVVPTQDLASAARRLGQGDLDASVTPTGPHELIELGTAFNDLGSQVSNMLARERELVAELSHRLRTPLTALRMRIDQIDDPELAAQFEHDLEGVTGAVNGLIREARGTLAGDATTCDFTDVVAERCRFWQVLAEDQQRQWTVSGDGQSVVVAIAPGEAEALVDVLIENVFAHTDEGTPVHIDLISDASRARLTVSDGGAGIEHTDQQRGTSSSDSTGLGLDIARTTAERAGGSFHIARSLLGGARIEVELPVAGHPAQ